MCRCAGKQSIYQFSKLLPCKYILVYMLVAQLDFVFLFGFLCVHNICLLFGRVTHFFRCFSGITPTQMSMTSLLLRYITPDASIGHTFWRVKPLGGGSAFFFKFFFVIIFCFHLAPAYQMGWSSNISSRRGSWWPREAVNAPWPFLSGVAWWPGGSIFGENFPLWNAWHKC